jgi:hypothetical protein
MQERIIRTEDIEVWQLLGIILLFVTSGFILGFAELCDWYIEREELMEKCES